MSTTTTEPKRYAIRYQHRWSVFIQTIKSGYHSREEAEKAMAGMKGLYADAKLWVCEMKGK